MNPPWIDHNILRVVDVERSVLIVAFTSGHARRQVTRRQDACSTRSLSATPVLVAFRPAMSYDLLYENRTKDDHDGFRTER